MQESAAAGSQASKKSADPTKKKRGKKTQKKEEILDFELDEPVEEVVPNVTINPEDTWLEAFVKAEMLCPSYKELFLKLRPKLLVMAKDLDEMESKGVIIVPGKQDIFRAFQLTPLHKVKVFFCGMDPYPQIIDIDGVKMPRATGLAFSVRHGDEVATAIKNIYKKIKQEYPGFVIPNHANLEHWAAQGVLLINAALTTEAGVSGAHINKWKGIYLEIQNFIAKNVHECIFVLLGRDAQKTFQAKTTSKHLIIKHSHPTSRNGTFLDANIQVFSAIDEYLTEPIVW